MIKRWALVLLLPAAIAVAVSCQVVDPELFLDISPLPTPTVMYLADLDRDGMVTILDYSAMAADTLGTCQAGLPGDINGDGCFDDHDWTVFLAEYALTLRRGP